MKTKITPTSEKNIMENKKNQELHEFYIGEKTTLTIENVLIRTKMTAQEYADFCNKRYSEGKISKVFIMSPKIKGDDGQDLTLVCAADEDGQTFIYYKCKG